jgi:hypothetical protein
MSISGADRSRGDGGLSGDDGRDSKTHVGAGGGGRRVTRGCFKTDPESELAVRLAASGLTTKRLPACEKSRTLVGESGSLSVERRVEWRTLSLSNVVTSDDAFGVPDLLEAVDPRPMRLLELPVRPHDFFCPEPFVDPLLEAMELVFILENTPVLFFLTGSSSCIGKVKSRGILGGGSDQDEAWVI